MKKLIYLAFVFIGILSCKNEKSLNNELNFDIEKYISKFKYGKLDSFKISDNDWQDTFRTNNYKRVSLEDYALIWQDSSNFNNFNATYYYSIQRSSFPYVEVTFLHEINESDGSELAIAYFIYKNGKLVSIKELADNWTDGCTYSSISKSKFINDSILITETKDMETEFSSDNEKNPQKIDFTTKRSCLMENKTWKLN